jgi:pimeloyl-ACP methyl ester carboxylesterase
LASSLQSEGHLVSTPTMPWAQNRIYDASFDEAMQEIDREIDSLRQKGAKLVVVAGHSLGANAALGYAASRNGAGGVIALAPAHSPELPAFIKRVAQDVRRAKDLVATGKGKEKHRFADVNQGRSLEVAATAEVYLSWFDPEGAAVMPRSAASFKVPTPLLLVVGSHDRGAMGKDYIFDKAPPHPKSRFVTVAAGHFAVPSAAIEEVVTWLGSLPR